MAHRRAGSAGPSSPAAPSSSRAPAVAKRECDLHAAYDMQRKETWRAACSIIHSIQRATDIAQCTRATRHVAQCAPPTMLNAARGMLHVLRPRCMQWRACRMRRKGHVLYHSCAARASTDVRDEVQQRDVDDLLLVDQVAHIILRILAHLPATGREQPAVDVTTLTAAAAKGAPRSIDRSRSIPTRPKRAMRCASARRRTAGE